MNSIFNPPRGDSAELAAAAPVALDPGLGGEQAQESFLRQYWRILLKRRWVILGVIALCLGVGALLAFLTPREYRASVSLEIARDTTKVLNNIEDPTPRTGVDQEFYQTQYTLLKSRALAERVVRTARLTTNDGFLINDGRIDEGRLASMSRAERSNAAVQQVLSHLEVVPVRLSSVVNVNYRSYDPELAARIANTIGEEFIQSNLARRFDASSYARKFLEDQLVQTRARLEESERKAVGYAGREQIINIAPTSTGRNGETTSTEQSLVGADLNALNTALAQARAARVAAESRYRQASAGRGATESLQNPAVNALRQQRATVSGEYSRQLADFGPDYPAVAALRAQLNELDRQISRETGRITQNVSQGLEAEFREAQATEQALASRVEQLKGGVLDLRRRSIQYNIFQRDVDTNRALYDALLQRYKEIGIAGGIGTNNISIVDRALPPGAPYKPSLRFNLLLGLLAGAVLGALAALLLEQLDESAVGPAEFQGKLGLPLLGSVPVMSKQANVSEVLEDRKNPLSEAYFSVLTGLQFSTNHGMPKATLLTSTQPAEGKSTSAYALAQSLARVGKRVLLIDADMRNPSVHRSHGLANTGGLSNLLVGDGKLQQYLHPMAVPGLAILTSGPIPPNPAELLAGNSFALVLEDALTQFDHVVVDGPPVLGLADAPLLARQVEATVFVMEAGRTRTSQARHALHRLFGVRAHVIGAILTKLDVQREGYGYGYGYDYKYG